MPQSKWVKPSFGHFRLDVDVGFDDRAGSYSIGAIIRDHAGAVIVAKAGCIRKPGSVIGDELMAVLQGLCLCKNYKVDHVDVFYDSKVAVQAVSNHDDFFRLEGSIIT